jgi:hypothetical protein
VLTLVNVLVILVNLASVFVLAVGVVVPVVASLLASANSLVSHCSIYY